MSISKWAGLVCALLVPLLVAADASACGYTVRARAQGDHAKRPPLIIGDSTMIFAAPWLGRRGLEADAKECRQFSEGVAMLAARRRAGTLPRLSLLALGANGPVSTEMIDRAVRAVGPDGLLGLVTPRKSGTTESSMRRAVSRHRGRVLLVDWVSFSAGRGGWFAGDGLHVTHDGARKYAAFVDRRTAAIADPPRSLKPPRSSRATKDCGVVRQLGRRRAVRVIRGAERVPCRRARELARTAVASSPRGWRAYWWSATGVGPWVDLYRREDGRVLIGTLPAR